MAVSLVTEDIKHLFMGFLAIRLSIHTEAMSVPILWPRGNGAPCRFSLSCERPSCIPMQLPYPILTGKGFLPSLGFLFTLSIVSPEAQKILISMKSSYLFLSLLLMLVVSYREASAKSEVMKIYSHFFGKSFIAVAFTFRFLIYDS